MNIGTTIAALRAERRMTQEELAGRLFVSRDLVSKWETGRRRPDYATIEQIARQLEVPPEAILPRDDYLFLELEQCVPREAGLTKAELTGHLNAFLRGLRKEERDLFVRRYYLLADFSELAAACGKKENHVRSALSKTRKKLKRYLKEKTS